MHTNTLCAIIRMGYSTDSIKLMMNNTLRQEIYNEFYQCVVRTLERVSSTDTYRPFHRALLSNEALFWSRFERSFSTSFGQRAIEVISRLAALNGGASDAERQKSTAISLPPNVLAAIEGQITALRSSGTSALRDWAAGLQHLQKIKGHGDSQNIRVISDLWWKKNGIDHYLSIKTVKPNIDQTAEAKRDLLKLKLNDNQCFVYFGLYYNPFGENRSEYRWSPPQGIFNFATDPVVLIGKDYWETLGGTGFYEDILVIANEVGEETKSMIRDHKTF